MLEPSANVVPLVFNECEESLFEMARVLKVANLFAGKCKEMSSTIDRVDPFLDVIPYVNKVIDYEVLGSNGLLLYSFEG